MAGGVIRLSPARSKTLVGRILPISPPIAEALARRRARRDPDTPLVFHRDGITDPPLAHGVAHRLPGGRGADPLPPRLSPHRRPQPDPRERPRAGRHAPDRAQEPRHLRPLQHYSRAGTARRRGPTRRVSRATGAGGTSPPAAPPGRTRRPAHRITPPPRTTRHRVKAHGPPGTGAWPGGGSGRTPPACAPRLTHGPQIRPGPRSWPTWRRGGRTHARAGPCRGCRAELFAGPTRPERDMLRRDPVV